MRVLETDYLVVGAGAAGMAFADVVLTESPYDVVLVDRRERPGGHWNDAYPFVRLHLPSAYYGVPSRSLGTDAIGPDGLYERATGREVLDYFGAVLDEQFLPSGRVRFLGGHDHRPGDRVVSRATGEETEIRVRRKVVDARYLETSVPATHTPSFAADPAVRVITVNALPDAGPPAGRYVVLGGGKTAMDACSRLLDDGVDPARIRWVRPRDSWLLDRARWQPLDQVWTIVDGFADELEAMAEARDTRELFERLEDRGRVLRIDPAVEPTMYHCASIGRDELAGLATIADVVRLGRVRRIEPDRLVLDEGELPARPDDLYVDCTARGLRQAPLRPVFEDGRVTVQQVRYCSPPFSAAVAAYVEVTRDDLAEQNRLCPPNTVSDRPGDLYRMVATTLMAAIAWGEAGDVASWAQACRLDVTHGALERAGDPRVARAFGRTAAAVGPALARARAVLAAG